MIGAALNRVWYGDEPPGALLRGLESIYARGLASRKAKGLAERARDLEARPIVVVGNLTAGGTGKTPLVMHLALCLQESGLKPGIVSRGYGRKGSGQMLVTADSPVIEAGDEPLLMAQRCGLPVMVDADREAGTRALFELGLDVVLADDGLQRWRLPRDIEICVIDGQRGLGNGHLLPAGPLRESPDRLTSVDQVVYNGQPRMEPIPGSIIMEITADSFQATDGNEVLGVTEFLDGLNGASVNAVAGIGSPDRFFRQLTSMGITISSEHEFNDHHQYRDSDFKSMSGLILMTEKDAVKCRSLGLKDAWALRINASLPSAWEQQFVDDVRSLVERKRQ